MIIKTKLTEKDFINVNFVLSYDKTSTKIFTGIIVVIYAISVFTAPFSESPLSQIFSPLLMVFLIPLFTYFTVKKNYAANPRISETIEYEFDKDYLLMKGESFNSQLSWEKVYKVTQTKNWILIWQNRQIANPIPKRDIWEGQMEDLKTILNEHQVKNNL